MKIVTCLQTGKKKWMFPMILLMAAMAGCVVHYERPGQTQEQFDRDKKYCEAVAEREYARKGTRICDEVDACLISKGWKRSQ